MNCEVCKKLQEVELGKIESMPVSCTIDDIRKFEDNPVWRDIKGILLDWLISYRDDLEEMGKDFDRNDISFTQGETHIIRCLLNMTNALKLHLEARNDERDDGQESAE